MNTRFLQPLVLVAASAAAGPTGAAIPAEAFTNDKLTAADTQRLLYDELVKRGVSREIAALATMDTKVVRDEPAHLAFVQTMLGGIRREVDIRLGPASLTNRVRVPVALEDGDVALAESVTMKRTATGLETSAAAYLPNAQLTGALLEQWRQQNRPSWWQLLLGIGTANAQGGAAGIAMSYGDSFVGSAGNAIGVQGMNVQSVIDTAKRVTSDPGVQDVRRVGEVLTDVTNAMQSATEGPKTLWQTRADTAGSVFKVLKTGYKVYTAFEKDDARRARLRALRDCAEHPTSLLAIRAQREDPNYRRATADAIADAERNLTVNTGLSVLSTVTNAVAGELLKKTSASGSTMAKGVSYLGKLEQKMLDHVADEYIMKDAGKGVTPCEPDCGPVFRPEPPPEDLASYPPGDLACSPSPESLVCEAAPPSASSAANFTPGPRLPPPPDPASQVCGVLKGAHLTYHYTRSTSGCSSLACVSSTEDTQFNGAVVLGVINDPFGYQGSGTGRYSASRTNDLATNVRCSSNHETANTSGNAELTVTVSSTINNDITGGLDTSAMPANTSVVDASFEGHNFHSDYYEKHGCDAPNSSSNDDSGDGLGCFFYGVDLYRPGVYVVRANNDPMGGVCMLQLSR